MSILVQLVARAFDLFYYLLIARIILSWIPVPDNQYTRPILKFVFDITEPLLRIFRGMLPMIGGGGVGLDLSPLIAMMVLFLVRTLLVDILMRVGL